jgi:putative membrane protein
MIKVLAAALGGLVLVGLIVWFGGLEIGAEVWQAGWAIPSNIVIHLVQLFSAACAWRLLVGERQYGPFVFFRFRLVREGVNSLLPVAQIGGALVAIRLMVAAGISGALAGAGTTLDLIVEVAMQLVFTLAGLALLGAGGSDPDWAPAVEGGVALVAILMVAFVTAQRAGLMRWIEGLFIRLQKHFPSLSLETLRGLHRELIRLQEERWALAGAAAFHFASWAGGMFEMYVWLFALGHEVTLRQAFVIESLGMAARSVGFAIPGALGVQEGAFILVCGLFGIAPDLALALSMLKRLREIIVGAAGLLTWQWSELSRWLKRRRA